MDRIGRPRALILVSVSLCAATVLGQIAVASAQAPNRAALVIRYSDGTVWTQCVTFSESEITGLQLLQRAGLDVVYSRGGTGDLLCKIGREGCDNPNQCLCQCKGAQCAYWSYWHMQDGNWQYSVVGASIYRVKPGAIDGWVWGTGTIAEAPQPPAVRFEQICGRVAPTTSPSLTHTPTPAPPPTDTPSATPVASDTTVPAPSPTSSAMRPALAEVVRSPSPQPSLTASSEQVPMSVTLASSPTVTQTSPSTSIAVASSPGTQSAASPKERGYIVFAAIVVALAIIGFAAWRRGRTGF